MKNILALLLAVFTCFAVSSPQTSGTYTKMADAKLDGIVDPGFPDTITLEINGDTFSGYSINDKREITGKIYNLGGLVLFTAHMSGGGYSCAYAGAITGGVFQGSFYDNKGQKGDMSWTRK